MNNYEMPTKAIYPPMGWNSWDCYGTTVNESEVLDNARVMVERLKPYGWDTIVVDIAWYDPTAKAHGYNEGAPIIIDEYGRQLPDPVRFPSAAGGKGFGPLVQKIHSMGLKFGIHVMRGIPKVAVERNLPVKDTQWTTQDIVDKEHVCAWNPDNYGLNQSHPGAQAWYDSQVDLFASWKVDFLKVDDMQAPFYTDEIHAYHKAIAKAEDKYKYPILLSLSPGTNMSPVNIDFLRDNAQMWRISDDLWDRWEDIHAQFARLAQWAPHQQSGGWADADMLPIGHIGLRAERGDDRESLLTQDELKSMLTLWSMARSPLMIGGDLPTSSQMSLSLLENSWLHEVTAHSRQNAQTLREPSDDGEYIVWRADAESSDSSQSSDEDVVYAAIFWTGSKEREITVPLEPIVSAERIHGKQWTCEDLWSSSLDQSHGDKPAASVVQQLRDCNAVKALIPAHGVCWLRVIGK